MSWGIAQDRLEEALQLGLLKRHFFAHRFHVVPKCGPDALKVFAALGRRPAIDASWQLLLFASPELSADLPDALHFDPDLQWHQQHLGRRGLVATANLLVEGSVLYSSVHLSDLVQRISRRRDWKTRVEKRFKGWHRLLLNAIAHVAIERGLRLLRTPTAARALAATDRARRPHAAMFERIYDNAVRSMFHATERDGWWEIGVDANRPRVLRAERIVEALHPPKTIAICHDIEAGSGHRGSPALAAAMDALSRDALTRMLDIESRAGVRATYHVVGRLLPGARAVIAERGAGRHAVAFHSFDHRVARNPLRSAALRAARALWSRGGSPFDYQLARCRIVDYRLKGYRPPQSVLGSAGTAPVLASYNFEWIASSARSLGATEPQLQRRIAWLPILFDDFDLHRGRRSYLEWERRALDCIERYRYVALSLHDCYAPHWLDRYAEFLCKVLDVAAPRTLDEVAADLMLAGAS